MRIIEGQEFKLNNVLSYRAKMTQQEVVKRFYNIEQFMLQNNIKKDGPVGTATFDIDDSSGIKKMDMELLIPIRGGFTGDDIYVLKPFFIITNALIGIHKGNPNNLQETIKCMEIYIVQNDLLPITATYNFTMNDAKPGENVDNIEIWVVVGISPNIT